MTHAITVNDTRRIFKYEVPIYQDELTAVSMPIGAELLHVDKGGTLDPLLGGNFLIGSVWLWALVDPEAELEDRYFEVLPTGSSPPAGRYVGTATPFPLVWHVWEVDEPRPL
jgi:hypothetical protein